ncbi:MAG: helix-turn-helix transcriptional regulator [Gammaproteobacteria bacterium]|nr:helix-turn-helix transcriptional regulator [Gammaproteobacteria bacterium]
MIVKRLRQKNNWSQEQLATLSGLSIRTIQRVESGQSASLETLKSLASVFETDISKLTEEITVIDKKSEKWKSQPWWIRINFIGVGTRKPYLLLEFLALIIGFTMLFIPKLIYFSPACFLAAYISCASIRYADNKGLWDI